MDYEQEDDIVDRSTETVNWENVPEISQYEFDEIGEFWMTHCLRTFELLDDGSGEIVTGVAIPVYENAEQFRTSIHYNDDVYGDLQFKSHEVETWEKARVDIGASISFWFERRGDEVISQMEDEEYMFRLVRYRGEDIKGRFMEVSYDPDNDRFVVWDEIEDTGRAEGLYFQEWDSVVGYFLNRLFPVWNLQEENEIVA